MRDCLWKKRKKLAVGVAAAAAQDRFTEVVTRRPELEVACLIRR
jgi:hypothetical protein